MKARALLEALYRAALEAAEPGRRTQSALSEPALRLACRKARRIGIFAAGKAAAAMARAALAELGPRETFVVLPKGHPSRGLPRGTVAYASHPEPDASSMRAARRALRFFEDFGEEDLIVCLISGGASSLLALPRPGMTFAEKRRAVEELVRAGASILAVNRRRTSLSAVKGGRLGRATRAHLATLVLSDVPGDRAAAVGSGPTLRGRRGDLVRIVGSNADGLEAAASEARRRGLSVVEDQRRLSGDARRAGRRLAAHAKRLASGTVFLGGGETAVALGRSRARGGRCLELALGAAEVLDGDRKTVLLVAGSDGRDGSSGAAGAFADGATLFRARSLGLDPEAAIARHDTRAFFAKLGDLFVTGPTGTNVGDWVFLIQTRS
jgi:hydroxypyruvate reductase